MRLYRCFGLWLVLIFFSIGYATPPSLPITEHRKLETKTGFLRFSYDNHIKMPKTIPPMGLVGINYFIDFTSWFYGGLGGYGSAVGTQGGLFTVGAEAGIHHPIIKNIGWDAGLFVGGGGGKASFTGGGLMLRPHAGLTYQLPWAQLGVFYSYITFPTGLIESQQVGLQLDVPMEFSYLKPDDELIGLKDAIDGFFTFEKDVFGLFLQAYLQRHGTKNTAGITQDGTIQLIGAEFDHYLSENLFGWIKTSGAYAGIPNGYMDVLGGLGYHFSITGTPLSIIPQLGLGAGGGGAVETGGGFLLNPLLGIEWKLIRNLSLRATSGYLWAPKGDFQVVPITGALQWHLDFAKESIKPLPLLTNDYQTMGWRIQLLNQIYIRPQRSIDNVLTPIELIGIQIDQLLSPWLFLSYQGMGAYNGHHAGGYATGMVGAGIQSKTFLKNKLQLFANLLVGAGGGGGLALSGGSIIEPVLGLRFALTDYIGLQGSVAEINALRNKLNTPALNLGLTSRFDTVSRIS